jgi:hypothetical protein
MSQPERGGRLPRDRLRSEDADTEAATAAATDEAVNAENYIPEPGENWVHWPPFDSADYLDAPAVYTVDDAEGEPKADAKEQGGTTTET